MCSPVEDRLKPPPSLKSAKKVIKLGGNADSNGKSDLSETVITCINPKVKKISLTTLSSNNKKAVSVSESKSPTKTTICLKKKMKFDTDVPKTIVDQKVDAKITENNKEIKMVSWPILIYYYYYDFMSVGIQHPTCPSCS